MKKLNKNEKFYGDWGLANPQSPSPQNLFLLEIIKFI